MKAFKNIVLLITISFGLSVNAQQTPAPVQSETITIIGATAHIGNGEVIENSVIIFEGGKIISISENSTSADSPQGKVIQAEGKHVYPGFIAPNTTLGLEKLMPFVLLEIRMN